MSEQLAWAAGVFDARHSTSRDRSRQRFQIKTTDRALLDRFRAVVQVGKVYGPYAQKALSDGYQRSPFFIWVALGEDAEALAGMLAPWLQVSRPQPALL